MSRVDLIIPDLQVPYHDPKKVAALVAFVKHFRPDGLICVGDELDSPQPSRWNKGMAGEYAGTLQRDIDLCALIMADFRSALGPDKEFLVSRSNHGDRIETYVKRYAPALGSLRSIDVPTLLRYPESGIEYLRKPTMIAPDWWVMHGDESNLNRAPGATALGLARKIGASVVCGHTHRLGLQPETAGVNGKTRTVWGFEVGNLMDMKQAGYLGLGAANWQQGFGLLYTDGRKVIPVPVPMLPDGSFNVEGRWYR